MCLRRSVSGTFISAASSGDMGESVSTTRAADAMDDAPRAASMSPPMAPLRVWWTSKTLASASWATRANWSIMRSIALLSFSGRLCALMAGSTIKRSTPDAIIASTSKSTSGDAAKTPRSISWATISGRSLPELRITLGMASSGSPLMRLTAAILRKPSSRGSSRLYIHDLQAPCGASWRVCRLAAMSQATAVVHVDLAPPPGLMMTLQKPRRSLRP